MGESRTELLAWLNDLLQINYTKVEQCGTGGAYCQVIDSIYGQSRSTPHNLGNTSVTATASASHMQAMYR